MKIRFQADADLNQVIVSAILCREPDIEFQTALAACLEGVKDPELLALTAQDSRVLVTHDQRTMPRHFSDFIKKDFSPGVLIIPQSLPVTSAVEELILIWLVMEAKEWENRIAFLPL